MRRSTPPAPATSSRSMPRVSARSRSRVATGTPCGLGMNGLLLIRFDQPEAAVFAAVDNADRVGLAVAEHHERLRPALDAQGGILDRHRLDRVTRRPDEPPARRGAWGRRRALASLGAHPLALALGPARLELARLALDLLDRLAHRQRPAGAFAVAA